MLLSVDMTINMLDKQKVLRLRFITRMSLICRINLQNLFLKKLKETPFRKLHIIYKIIIQIILQIFKSNVYCLNFELHHRPSNRSKSD